MPSPGDRVKPVTLLLTIVVLTNACGSGPTAPSPPPSTPPPASTGSLAGVWAGTVTHPQAGTGTVRITLGPLPAPPLIGDFAYEGTWEMTFGAPSSRRQGTLSILVESTTRISGALLSASPPFCAMDPTLWLMLQSNQNRLSGSILYGFCEPITTGEITLVKQ